MGIKITGNVVVTGDCGHKIEIPVTGIDSETDLVCPVCGAVDRLNDEQVANIREQLHAAAADFGREEVGKRVDEMLTRVARNGGKNVKYTPKRR